MIRNSIFYFALGLVSLATPLRAARTPHAGADSRPLKVWTNEDLEKLRGAGMISIVGQVDHDGVSSPSVPEQYVRTSDPAWYAEQAAILNEELQRRQAQLREYQQALDDARSLRESSGGIDLSGGFAITPDAGISFLRQRVLDLQARLDDLEDLARRNDIDPGTLRGR